jgi:hypothetical protein
MLKLFRHKKSAPVERISTDDLPNVERGEHTFGQHLQLVQLFDHYCSDEKALASLTSGTDVPFEFVSQVCKIMGVEIKGGVRSYARAIKYTEEVCNGVKSWLEKSSKLLKYEPTTDEVMAGYEELQKKQGQFGTIKAIAKEFGKSPDEVLEWEWVTVFTILFTDLEEAKYQKRLYANMGKKKG